MHNSRTSSPQKEISPTVIMLGKPQTMRKILRLKEKKSQERRKQLIYFLPAKLLKSQKSSLAMTRTLKRRRDFLQLSSQFVSIFLFSSRNFQCGKCFKHVTNLFSEVDVLPLFYSFVYDEKKMRIKLLWELKFSKHERLICVRTFQ